MESPWLPCKRRVQMHPRLHPAGCIVPCITVHQISQRRPHVLIQSMRTSFCIYRLINRQNTGYNYQIWAIGAVSGQLCVILSDGDFRFSALFSLLTTAFRGRNQRFIIECTLRWTITEYRPQCEVPSKVSRNRVKCPLKVDTVKVQIPIRGQRKIWTRQVMDTPEYEQKDYVKCPGQGK